MIQFGCCLTLDFVQKGTVIRCGDQVANPAPPGTHLGQKYKIPKEVKVYKLIGLLV